MRARHALSLAGGLGLIAAGLGAAGAPASVPGVALAQPAPSPPSLPGVPAPARVIEELRATLGRAVQRFEARDLPGVLAHVSEEYRSGPLTKAAIRGQLAVMFQVYDATRARVRIDEVRLQGDHAWIYSTGEAWGQLPFVGQWMSLVRWEREPEVARRENGGWRLYGSQQ